MGFDEGQIILDSDNAAYYSGQTIYGRIVFDQDKVKTIHGIYVDVKGFCKVHWTSQNNRMRNDRRETYTVYHDSHEEYFRRKTYVFGDASGEHHLQPGHHEFRFDCPIPVNCPSSFEGSVGHIRYRVKAVMLTTGIFSSNKEKMVPIRIFAPLDLNQNPVCKEPIEFELISSYCCWCISSGSSELQVKLPVGGYCPGQIIPLEVTCKNPSSVEIDEIKFAIKKDITFTAASEPSKRYENDTVLEIRKGPVPAGTTRNWTVEMEVPAMEVHNLNACRFIDIDYQFKVSTEVGGCHEGTEETNPIIFGTIPLVGFQDNVQNPLHDQMPKTMQVQNVQGANFYPTPPIINQPLPNSPYPNGNVYPNSSPYPAGGNPPYPPGSQPFPNVSPFPPSQPYPSGNSPVPGRISPYPAGNSPYPPGTLPYSAGNSPYPPGNAPYPAVVSPYPTNTPYSTDNSPHEANAGPVPPYPGSNQSPVPPYPGSNPSPVPPYPSVTGTTLLKTGNFGFTVPSGGDAASVPLLPPGANVPYPTSPPSNPYIIASAPEPSTPGSDEKKPPLDGTTATSYNPAYNPEFMNNDKKDEKIN